MLEPRSELQLKTLWSSQCYKDELMNVETPEGSN